MTYILQDVYNELRSAFRGVGIETPDIDARLLICHFADISKEDFLTNNTLEISSGKYAAITLAMQERLSFKPVSKIVGEKEFYGRLFFATENTLDPRPETELIVDAVLERTQKDEIFTILDVGTGTGCIVLSILAERPNAIGFASDVSMSALVVAQNNAERLEITNRIYFIQASWLDAIEGQFDYLVSNPPYIRSEEIPLLAPDVRNHDPILALDGGKTGIYPYKKLLEKIKNVLKHQGRAFFEIGEGQISDIERLVADVPSNLERIIPDIAGIPRVVDISNGDK